MELRGKRRDRNEIISVNEGEGRKKEKPLGREA